MLQDLADCFRVTISPHFGPTSYGKHSDHESASSCDVLADFLQQQPDPIEELLLDLLPECIPDDVGFIALTAPFPGNMLVPFELPIGVSSIDHLRISLWVVAIRVRNYVNSRIHVFSMWLIAFLWTMAKQLLRQLLKRLQGEPLRLFGTLFSAMSLEPGSGGTPTCMKMRMPIMRRQIMPMRHLDQYLDLRRIPGI